MKNIDSIIDKACVEYCEQVNSVYNEKDIFKAGANFALSKIPPIMIDIAVEKYKYLNRWRKVEEDLPEVDNHLQYSVVVFLVKLKFGIYNLAVYHSSGRWLEPETELDVNDVIEWKPIE